MQNWKRWLNVVTVLVVLVGAIAVVAPAGAASPDPAGFEAVAAYIDGRLKDWTPTITAEQLYENLNDGDTSNDPFILSVRKPEDYARGHIPGAYNIPYKNLADPQNLAALPKDRPIVVYCYTGYIGGVGATFLRLMGYDAVNLEYGMTGWTDDPEVMATKPFEGPMGYPTETTPHPLTETYSAPDWTATFPATTPIVADAAPEAAITETIRQHAAALLPTWAPTIGADALYENLNDGDEANDPFILSVRKPEDYAKGHVAGAHNIFWKDIAKAENLAKLPPDQPIVAYCYTGHTGQVATTVLALLGYNVTNLRYGMMGWTDDATVLATQPFEGPMGYPTETTPHPLPAS